MSSLLLYGVETILVSVVFYISFLLIKRYSNPSVRRILLMCSLVLIVILPMLNFSVATDSVVPPVFVNTYLEREVAKAPLITADTSTSVNQPSGVRKANSPLASITFPDVLIACYFVGLALFLVKLCVGVSSVLRLRSKSVTQNIGGNKIYLTDRPGFTGASFFNMIFIGQQILSNKDHQTIIRHEEIHATRWHSVDVLMGEIFRAFFWFNPISWFYRSEIRHTTELDVDCEIITETGRKEYSSLIVHLSTPGVAALMNNFSAVRIKSRLQHIAQPIRNRREFVYPISLVAIGLAFFFVSCTDDRGTKMSQVLAMEDVKSITSTFTSHQADTQEKDSRIVAVVNIDPTGNLTEFNQHLTYPYTMEHIEPREFWSPPNPHTIHLLMDGLGLEHAENNILYGNSWPKKFAPIAEVDHPKFKRREWREHTTAVSYASGGLPDKIVTESRMPLRNTNTSTWTEEFEYDDDKITTFRWYQKYNEWAGSKFKFAGADQPSQVKYNYDNDHLIEVSHGRRMLKFAYTNDQMVRSELWIEGKLYNTRVYHYLENGLKEKTEILNVYGEPEYTIHYRYEYY